jgi:hypothetical protein
MIYKYEFKFNLNIVKMKIHVFFGLLFFISSSFAQTTVELPTDFIRNEILKKNKIDGVFKGSPYLNEVFLYGDIIVDNTKVYKNKLRFNAFSDAFEIQSEDNKITGLNKSFNVTVLLYGRLYQLYNYKDKSSEKTGYFQNLNPNGKNVSLLRKDIKKFIEAKKAISSYSENKPAKFVLETRYFIKQNNVSPIVEIKLNSKTILEHLKNHSKLLKVFIKKNKLKLKNENEVVRLFNYYNTL